VRSAQDDPFVDIELHHLESPALRMDSPFGFPRRRFPLQNPSFRKTTLAIPVR
jgi:hypothetical protein